MMLSILKTLKLRWIKKGDWQNGVMLAGIFALVALTLVIQDQTVPMFALNTAGWVSIFGLIVVSYLTFCWARGASLWARFKSERRTPVQRRDSENPFGELFVYLIIGLAVLCCVALAAAGSAWLWPWQIDLNKTLNLLCFFTAILVVFLPLVFAFRAHVAYAHGENVFLDHISNESLAFGVSLIGLVMLLAWVAGKDMIPTDRNFGAVIMIIVLALFLVFIAVPYVHAFLLRRPDKKSSGEGVPVAAGFVLTNPASIASWFDGVLVRKLAPLTGATQNSLWPHLLLICVFLPFTIMGYALPAPYGLLPIFFALLLAVALGRRWAWVENDRETAMRLHSTENNMMVGFRNDLRDEALLGYAFLFVLVPLALRQLQLWIEPFDAVDGIVASNSSLTDWAQFFGIELAKAVPIVDWADIYGIQPDVPFQATDAFSRHLVFGARLMVDLVIIAALLQAWSIMQRNTAQMQLFKDGQLDLLDPFTEQAHFSRGVEMENGEVVLKPALAALFKAHAESSRRLRRGYVPYNPKRLSEILAGSDEKMRAMVIKLAEDYGVLVGSLREQVGMLARRWEGGTPSEWADELWVRDQRLTMEKLLNEALDKESDLNLTRPDSIHLRSMLAKIADKPDFYNAKLMAFKLLGKHKSVHAVQALTAGLFRDFETVKAAGFQHRFPHPADWQFAKDNWQETRAEIIKALVEIRFAPTGYGPLSDRAKSFCEEVFIWVEAKENKHPADVARKALALLEKEDGLRP